MVAVNFQKTYYFVQPMRTLSDILARREKIQTDPVRTPHERQSELQRIDLDKQSALNKVRSALANDWAEIKSQYKTLQSQKTGAADRAARRWDYARLDYERKTAREFIQSANLWSIKRHYKDLALKNDTHAMLAYVEEAVNLLPDRAKSESPDIGMLGDLLHDFRTMRDDLTITPEMKELAKQGEILTERVSDVYEATRRAQNNTEANDPAFDQMTQGVRISKRFRAEDLAEITEVSLDWD